MTKEKKDLAKAVKKLTPAELKKESKKLDGKKEFTVAIGETEYKLEHDVFFRSSKQNQVLDEVLKFYELSDEKGTEILDLAVPYTALMLIKHFTTLDVPDDFDEAILLLEVLIDLGVLGAILDQLPEDEVEKVYDMLFQAMTIFRENLERAEEEIQEKIMSGEIENKEMLGLDDIEEEVDLEIYVPDPDEPIN